MNNKDTEITHTEAPRSATVKVKSANGFNWLFTMRETTGQELITDIESFEKVVLAKGWMPVEERSFGGSNASFNKPPKVTKPCLIPGHPELVEKLSKKTGKPYFGHWEGRYPDLGRQCFGQGYVGTAQFTQTAQPEIPERDIQEDF